MAKKSRPKEPNEGLVVQRVMLVLMNVEEPKGWVGERYQLLEVPRADQANAVDNFNNDRMYGAHALPKMRALTCLVFSRKANERPRKRLAANALEIFAAAYELGCVNGYHSGYSDGKANTGRRGP